MADPKRQSVSGGKTKNAWGSGAPAPASGVAAAASDLSRAIGAKVRITTALSSQPPLEGTIFTVDPTLDLLAIRDANSPALPANGTSTPTSSSGPAPGNYRIIPVSQISSFKILTLAEANGESSTFENAASNISRIDVAALKAREEKAIEDAKKQEASRGKGVSADAQELFDFISRTLPTRWAAQTIVANDSVLIEPPYATENMRAPADKQNALTHTRRIVEAFWQKKGGRQSSGSQHTRSQSTTPAPVASGGPPARAPVPAVPLKKGG